MVAEPHCRTQNWQSGNGILSCQVQGGSGPYSFNWLDSNLSPLSNGLNQTTIIKHTGLYFLSVTDATGEMVMDSILVTDSINPVANFELNSPDFFQSDPFEAYEMAAINLVRVDSVLFAPPPMTVDTSYSWVIKNKSLNLSAAHHYNRSDEYEFDTTVYEKGLYEVCLIARNYHNCRDTLCKEFSILSSLIKDPHNQVMVFPDFHSQTIQFHSKAFSNAHDLHIFSIDGKLVYSEAFNSPIHSLSFNNAKSVYVYSVTLGDHLVEAGKFVFGL
jgi:hypothetical protein